MELADISAVPERLIGSILRGGSGWPSQVSTRYLMTKSRLFRVVAVAIVFMLPVFLSGCISRDMRLANKGFSQIEDGKLVDAESVLTEAVQANPNNAYAALNLGTVYQRTGRFEQARALFEKVIALDAQNKPDKRSKFVDPNKNLREIAEDNLRLLPPKR
jgi:tetratricopeptide (TPR) repeat protein